MTQDVWIFPLEPLDNRYTAQWYDEIPNLIQLQLDKTGHKVYEAIGTQRSTQTTTGAFLDFADTNFWKSTQLADFVVSLNTPDGVADDAVILFTDFWNPALLQVAYMRDLLGKAWQIQGIAHAGAYDPSDILGLKMQKPWPWHLERSLFYASDVTYFATNFHRDMFLKNLDIPEEYHDRAVVSGQPHNAITRHMALITVPQTRSRQIIWPHRYNQDKQPEIAEDLATEFDMVITQKLQLNKNEYYNTIADTQLIFSCALHENLGISIMEGVLLGAVPVVPDRCSYSEMYLPEFIYPSEWTESWENYQKFRPNLVKHLNNILDNIDSFAGSMQIQKEILVSNYLTADTMINRLTGSST